MDKNIIATEKAPKAIGPYSQGWRIDRFIFTSGQLGIDMETGKLAEGIVNQTHASMKNLKAILEEAGSDLEHVIKTTVFVQNLNDFSVVNEIYGSYFNGEYPSRSCVQVARLPMGGLVEIECIAIK
ncbi:MAG: RidA family protein [Clostridiales bacterium]|nr:RidA family protein [Roseburia sp.]MDD7635392.1 RidA family protein [Clostridiales bacterium]MDY4112683.1 RidA family protein [Roseburia sp.]